MNRFERFPEGGARRLGQPFHSVQKTALDRHRLRFHEELRAGRRLESRGTESIALSDAHDLVTPRSTIASRSKSLAAKV